jgi:2-amino-4-hydroxy-6-hydroxymethyldihydropteridine diphosphokinase
VTVRAFIGMGSNLGDRWSNCRAALDGLARVPDTRLVRVSPFFESDPQEGVEGGRFLNAVAELETGLTACELLRRVQEIEVALGRHADHPPGSARTMDLDILLYGDQAIREERLTVPHPRLTQRRFVLAPLVSLDPTVRPPGLDGTAEELLRRLDPKAQACTAVRSPCE